MTTILVMACIFVAIGLAIVAKIWILVAAFRDSILWGVLILLGIPLVELIFVITHWEDVRTAFLLYLGAVILFVALIFMGPSQSMSFITDMQNLEQTGDPDSSDSEESSFSFSQFSKKMKKDSETRKMREITQSRGYTGRRLLDIEEELGPPPARFEKSDGSVHYGYSTLELISADGITVTDEIHR